MSVIFDPFLKKIRKKDSSGGSFATQSEVNEGVIANKSVSPLTLNGWDGGLKIPLAACSALGKAASSSGPLFTWKDPSDVVLNGATLAKWNQTILVRKAGNYPLSPTDGTIIARTSIAQGNKDYYNTHNICDTSAEEGVEYGYQLFSQTTSGTWNLLDGNRYSPTTGESWSLIQSFIRAGRGAELYQVGTVFYVDHPEYTHEDSTGLWWRVNSHDKIQPADHSLTHSMGLDLVDCLFNAQYDASELYYCLTEDILATVGKSYYTLSGSTYTKLVEGTDYQVGDTVPVASWYEKNIDGRQQYGNNYFPWANLLQWANSSAAAGQNFTKKHLHDVACSTYSGKSGFCRFIDPEFLAVVQPAELITAKANCDGAGSVLTNTAKFWPLSMTQVFGSTNNGIPENVQLDYYITGSKVKTLMNRTSATNWWLRSPFTFGTYNVYYVSPSGASDGTNANRAYAVSLACIVA